VTRDWVRRAAPLLVIALKLAQLAMTAYGIPFPLPSLPFDVSFDNFLGKYIYTYLYLKTYSYYAHVYISVQVCTYVHIIFICNIGSVLNEISSEFQGELVQELLMEHVDELQETAIEGRNYIISIIIIIIYHHHYHYHYHYHYYRL
jgi:hypothetical protein